MTHLSNEYENEFFDLTDVEQAVDNSTKYTEMESEISAK